MRGLKTGISSAIGRKGRVGGWLSIQQVSRSRCNLRECHSAAPRPRTGCPLV